MTHRPKEILMSPRDDLTAHRDALARSATELSDIAAGLDVAVQQVEGIIAVIDGHPPPPLPPPTPPVGSAVVPRDPIAVLATGPHAEQGGIYTGLQVGHLFTRPDGERWADGWPAYTRPQGQYAGGWCELTGLTDGWLRLVLTREGHPFYSATTDFQQHLPARLENRNTGGYPAMAIEFTYRHVSGERYRTIKLPGLVGFNDGNWAHWPGGGGGKGGQNFSVRPVLNSDLTDGEPRFSVYMYLGRPGQKDTIGVGGPSDHRRFESNEGRTVQIVATAGVPFPREGRDIRVRLEVDVPAGTVRYMVDMGNGWRRVMDLDGIEFAATGPALVTRGYPQVMYGGRDESFAPQNDMQTGIIDLGEIAVERLA
jgi:hypothetical protein